MCTRLLRVLVLLVIEHISFQPEKISAQPAVVTGKVMEAGSGLAIPGVTVRVIKRQDTSSVKGCFTDLRGQYTCRGFSAGEYRMSFTSIGYESLNDTSFTFTGNDTINMNITLEHKLVSLDVVTISASRTPEKILDAPASVTVIDSREISGEPSLTPADHVRGTAGVDIAQTGLMQQSIITRGFNNVASTSLTMLTDNRIAAVPSLRINVPSFIPLVNDDIDRIEVVRGPASALYGPNAHQGVLHIITRSPFASQGTSLSVTAGERSLFIGSIRNAGLLAENVGYKISGQYFRGNDWEYEDSVEIKSRDNAIANGARPDTLKIARRESVVERFSGEARTDFLVSEKLSANLTLGFNQAVRSIELTDIGAAQIKEWRSTFIQGRVNYSDLFVQAYLNRNDAGSTYILRTGNPVVDRSTQFVAQAQHSSSIGETQRFIYGLDLLLTRPVTGGTINGRNEEKDDINEYGGYIQSETHLVSHSLDLIFAGRIDKHNQLNDPVISPRAAVVLKPWENQNFRLTYNRAYSTPATSEFFLDILADDNVFGFPDAYALALRASGVPNTGFTFNRDDDGRPYLHSKFSPDPASPIPVDGAALLWPAVVQILAAQGKDLSSIPAPSPADIRSAMANLNTETQSFDPVAGPTDIAPLKPTITQTIELGYKGVVADKLQVGVDLYRSKITDFVGPFQVITPNVFLNEADTKKYLQQQGFSETDAAQCAALIAQIPLGTVTPKQAADPTTILLAPRNYGNIDLMGIDLSLGYQLSEQFFVGGTYSYVDKNFFEKLDGIANLALNAPRNKGSFAIKYRSRNNGFNAEVRSRWTEGFRMSSGVYSGIVNSYSLVDATVGYTIPSFDNITTTLSATNLLDKKHREFIGAPEIGRLVMGRVTYAF